MLIRLLLPWCRIFILDACNIGIGSRGFFCFIRKIFTRKGLWFDYFSLCGKGQIICQVIFIRGINQIYISILLTLDIYISISWNYILICSINTLFILVSLVCLSSRYNCNCRFWSVPWDNKWIPSLQKTPENFHIPFFNNYVHFMSRIL